MLKIDDIEKNIFSPLNVENLRKSFICVIIVFKRFVPFSFFHCCFHYFNCIFHIYFLYNIEFLIFCTFLPFTAFNREVFDHFGEEFQHAIIFRGVESCEELLSGEGKK
ncbi:MAG: hypothetical protein DBY45_02695 [Clostridiales bacterium]|nr:MAG: hypothetical protein DBY45_02695 [Clostridiales bacterium]